jgi:beta-glucosidase
VGTSEEWESEGFNRPDLDLMGEQNALIEAVAAANPRTVVVLNTGSPVTMPWLDKVAAVVQAWFPGQECGNAIADVLFGAVNPSGRLPQTFPKRIEDTPAYISYPGCNGEIQYNEGIFLGYRYYDAKKVDPLFPFGYGLSYTDFTYGNLQLSTSHLGLSEALHVSVDVSNTGSRAGKEVVQLYLEAKTSSVHKPERELKGFTKTELNPGEIRTVKLKLDYRSLAYFDVQDRRWVAEAGEYEVFIGGSSRDIMLSASFKLRETVRFGGPKKRKLDVSLDSQLWELLGYQETRVILEKYIPALSQSPDLGFLKGFALWELAGMYPDVLDERKLRAIEKEFADGDF